MEAEPTSAELVADFHRALGVRVPTEATRPTMNQIEVQTALVAEEVAEMFDEIGAFRLAAAIRGAPPRIELRPEEVNFPRLLKELNDTQYVLDGMYVRFGLVSLKERSFREVHRSNMTKTLGQRHEPGHKVAKGPAYEPADMEQFFRKEEPR